VEEGEGSWHRVPVEPPPPGGVVGFEIGAAKLLLANAEGALYALEDQCPHVRVPLSGGRLRGCVLQCPEHGGRLDVRDGSPVERPIRRSAVTYALRQGDGGLEICLP